MITNQLNLSMSNPKIVQAFAKQGDKGRIYKINLDDATEENGTMRIKRIDGEEYTSEARKQNDISPTTPTDLVSFNALEEVPLTKLEVGLSSSQDLHGYDNPWPSGGSANKWDEEWEIGGIGTVGQLLPSVTDRIRSKNYIPVSPNTTYYRVTSVNVQPFFYKSDETFISYGLWGKGNFTTPAETALMKFQVDPVYGTTYNHDLGINYPSTVTTYSPYSNICPIYPSNGKNLITQPTYTASSFSTVADFGEDRHFDALTVSFLADNTSAGATNSAFVDFLENGGTHHYVILRSFKDKNGTTFYNANTPYSGVFSYTATDITFRYVNIYYMSSSYSYIATDSMSDFQLELGSSATPYVPYQGINLYQVGKNFFNVESVSSITPTTVKNADGSLTVTGSRTGNNAYVLGNAILPQGTYTLSKGSGTGDLYFQVYANGGTIANTQNGDATFTLAEDTSVAFRLFIRGSVTYNNTIYPQCEKGSSATPYEPYNGTTHSISLGRSVYGGYVDLVSGKLTVNKAYQSITGTDVSTVEIEGTAYRISLVNNQDRPAQANVPFGMSNKYTYYSDYSDVVSHNNSFGFSSNRKQVIIRDDTLTSTTAVTDSLNSVPLEMVMTNFTPTVIDLTPTQISTLLGENNIWSSGEVEVAFEYDGVLAELPQQATEIVGNQLGDVDFNGASTMPFILTVKSNHEVTT